jgi:hypothetical protein
MACAVAVRLDRVVKASEVVATPEVMKMETVLHTPRDGRIGLPRESNISRGMLDGKMLPRLFKAIYEPFEITETTSRNDLPPDYGMALLGQTGIEHEIIRILEILDSHAGLIPPLGRSIIEGGKVIALKSVQ